MAATNQMWISAFESFREQVLAPSSFIFFAPLKEFSILCLVKAL